MPHRFWPISAELNPLCSGTSSFFFRFFYDRALPPLDLPILPANFVSSHTSRTLYWTNTSLSLILSSFHSVKLSLLFSLILSLPYSSCSIPFACYGLLGYLRKLTTIFSLPSRLAGCPESSPLYSPFFFPLNLSSPYPLSPLTQER